MGRSFECSTAKRKQQVAEAFLFFASILLAEAMLSCYPSEFLGLTLERSFWKEALMIFIVGGFLVLSIVRFPRFLCVPTRITISEAQMTLFFGEKSVPIPWDSIRLLQIGMSKSYPTQLALGTEKGDTFIIKDFDSKDVRELLCLIREQVRGDVMVRTKRMLFPEPQWHSLPLRVLFVYPVFWIGFCLLLEGPIRYILETVSGFSVLIFVCALVLVDGVLLVCGRRPLVGGVGRLLRATRSGGAEAVRLWAWFRILMASVTLISIVVLWLVLHVFGIAY